jgi:hypothetical protein
VPRIQSAASAVALVLAGSAAAQSPAGFTVLPAVPDQAQFDCVVHGYAEGNWWQVSNAPDGTMRILASEESAHDDSEELPFRIPKVGHGRITALHLEHGWLVGSEAGEWGGSLRWFSEDGKRSKDLQATGDDGPTAVQGMVALPSGIFVAQGSGHEVGVDHPPHGRVVRVSPETLQVQFVAALPHWPRAILKESDSSLLVLALNRLVRVKASGAAEDLGSYLPVTRHSGTAASMARDGDGTLWLGMWHYLLHVRLESNRIADVTWLAPVGCQNFDASCKCMTSR